MDDGIMVSVGHIRSMPSETDTTVAHTTSISQNRHNTETIAESGTSHGSVLARDAIRLI